MVKPKNLLNIMIEMPEYFNTWLFLNDFNFKKHSIKENKVYFESKKYIASINISHFCRIESKEDHEILFVFLIPKDRSKFDILKNLIVNNFFSTVALKVG